MFDKFISKYMKTTTDPSANIDEQLSQVDQTSGGVEGAKKKYGVALKKGGRVKKMQKGGANVKETVKKTAKKIEEASKQSGPKPPKGNIKNIPSGYMDFGAQLDPTDKKVFLYGVKKIGDDTFLQGAAKGEKDFKANIQKGNIDLGISRQGDDKQISLNYTRNFNKGGFVCKGNGLARKKKTRMY